MYYTSAVRHLRHKQVCTDKRTSRQRDKFSPTQESFKSFRFCSSWCDGKLHKQYVWKSSFQFLWKLLSLLRLCHYAESGGEEPRKKVSPARKVFTRLRLLLLLLRFLCLKLKSARMSVGRGKKRERERESKEDPKTG